MRQARERPLGNMPQSVLHHLSYLRGTARLGEPQEVVLLKELNAQGVERIPGEKNHALVHAGRFGLEQMIQVLPVEFRHAQVAQDEVIPPFVHLDQRGSPVVYRLYGMPITAKERGQRFGKTGLIIHNQNR